ncbi:uncharacterized protein LOC115670908 [Syzygium oleosum]|uniref:uncharacterized protein LOC115670908 n=1 Tax=Syzygium oleosum TaxID=219896 RepID=UPI0011D190B9|nr:uncharacterized protein LOC115670908 [Syzygium oleosum]
MLTVALNANLPPFSCRHCTSSSSASASLVLLVPPTFGTRVSYRRSSPPPSKSLFAGPPLRSLVPPSPRFRGARFDVRVVPGRRHGGFRVGASRRRRKGGNLEADGLERSGKVMGYGDDDHDDYDDNEEEEEEEDEDEDEEGMYSPFEKMTRWHENKPPGFGVGKVYDTSLEDKLLEEMHQSRVAQAANINKLNNPVTPTPPGKDEPRLKVAEALPSGIPVRVANLPKKKNIHRDLRLAFKEVDGITGIHPVVSGNKKTRDPVCTGFALVYFKSEEHAMSFVQTFSRRSLTFGKVQKQIKCEMMTSRLPVHANAELASNTLVTSQISMPNMEGEPDLHADIYEPTSGSLEDLTSEKENDWNDEIKIDEYETREDTETFDMSDFETFDTLESGTKIATASSLTEQQGGKATLTRVAPKQKKPRPNPKKPAGKGKAEKVLKLEVPGSAKRLKIQEKAVLTGVLSKYGGKVALTSNDTSLG